MTCTAVLNSIVRSLIIYGLNFTVVCVQLANGPSLSPSLVQCDRNFQHAARVFCNDCEMHLCDNCDRDLHRGGPEHVRKPLAWQQHAKPESTQPPSASSSSSHTTITIINSAATQNR